MLDVCSGLLSVLVTTGSCVGQWRSGTWARQHVDHLDSVKTSLSFSQATSPSLMPADFQIASTLFLRFILS